MQEAYRRGIIDTIAVSIDRVSEDADVIIFATPVNTTVRLLKEVPTWTLKKECHYFRYGQYKRSDYGSS